MKTDQEIHEEVAEHYLKAVEETARVAKVLDDAAERKAREMLRSPFHEGRVPWWTIAAVCWAAVVAIIAWRIAP